MSAYMGGIRGSGVFSSTGGVCDMFSSGRGGRCWGCAGERIGFGFYQSWRRWDMCLCFGCGGVGGVGGGMGVVGRLGQALGGWCGVMSVCVGSLDYLC